MKVLDVALFHEGLERNTAMLQRLGDEMAAIQKATDGLIAMDDALKGEGGNAIRSFYEEWHLPFLLFFDVANREFIDQLRWMSNALDALEPHPAGHIKEAFLEGDVEAGLEEIANLTESLTDESNTIMNQVADIVGLPHLDDSDVQEGVQRAKLRRDETITQLGSFDAEQTNALMAIEANFSTMETWLTDIEGLFKEGLTDVDFLAGDWIEKQRYTPIWEANYEQKYNSLDSHPRVTDNDVDIYCKPNYSDDSLWEGLASTTGVSLNDWKEVPVNSSANLGITANSAYEAAKDINLARQGFGIARSKYTTAQDKTRVRLKLERPELIGVKYKTYSHTNATNYTKIFRRVDPMTNIKQTLKWTGNKIGYVGLGTAVVGDVYHGNEKNLPATEIAGNVTGTVAVGMTSIVASAYAGAKVGAITGALGGPVGVAVGATVGLVAGIGVTFFLDKIKFMDVDKDGKKDSVSDAIKKGTTGLLNKVSSWFK